MPGRNLAQSRVFLGLGSNLGDRWGHLQRALGGLARSGVRLIEASPVFETEPVGMVDQGTFLNLAVEVTWEGEARALLDRCLGVEQAAGRVRRLLNGPRTLDIDILLMGDRVIRDSGLEVPHPRAHRRRFVLVPLAEIASDFVHPILKRSVGELLAECEDPAGVRWWGNSPALMGWAPPAIIPSASRDK